MIVVEVLRARMRCAHTSPLSLQAKAEHVAAIEEQRRLREELYRRQMEEQARLEAEAKAQVRSATARATARATACLPRCVCLGLLTVRPRRLQEEFRARVVEEARRRLLEEHASALSEYLPKVARRACCCAWRLFFRICVAGLLVVAVPLTP
jgi:hypothetical protein